MPTFLLNDHDFAELHSTVASLKDLAGSSAPPYPIHYGIETDTGENRFYFVVSHDELGEITCIQIVGTQIRFYRQLANRARQP